MSSSSSSSHISSSGACQLGITLRREAQTRLNVVNTVDGFRLRITAHDACGMPAEIFRYLRQPFNPLTSAQADRFDGVCSAVDLEEFPSGAPTDNVPPFFRQDAVDLLFRSQHDADDAWTCILEDVQILVNTLTVQERLEVEEEARIEAST